MFAGGYQEFRARGRFSSLADEPFPEDGGESGLGLEPLRGGRFHSSAAKAMPISSRLLLISLVSIFTGLLTAVRSRQRDQ
jgi:hypothetical protein